MKRGESHKSGTVRRPSGEALWNAAAAAGLLLIGLLLGGIAGVFLDRQGLLGGTAPEGEQIALAAPELPKPEELRRAPLAQPDPAFDREALEAAYQQALRRDRPEAGEAPGGAAGEAAPATLPEFSPPEPESAGPPPWQQHAVAAPPSDGRPMIAIVLYDVGVNRRGASKAIALPAPLTLAFMTYAQGLAEMTADARRAGHELMLHVPMQPRDAAHDPGPNVLRDDLPRAELLQRLQWGLGRFEGYVGINNHMGSRFTGSAEGMALVMDELKARGLLFLDSLTAPDSQAGRLAARAGVPFAVRDVFVDNEPDDAAAIHRQLAILEETARERGYAVGIGHPHDGTVAALAQWIPAMRARGFALVPISAVVRHRQRLAAHDAGSAG